MRTLDFPSVVVLMLACWKLARTYQMLGGQLTLSHISDQISDHNWGSGIEDEAVRKFLYALVWVGLVE